MKNKSVYILLFGLLFLIGCKNPKKQKLREDNRQKTEDALVEANRILVQKDQQKIKGFVKRSGWNMQETSTGLWYEILEPGIGDTLKTDIEISFKYKVSLLDGTECYNSDEDGIKSFTIGKGGVESGLEQGVLLLKEGAKARFIMPPYLAHGLTGDGERIPARAIIIYEIELIPHIKHQ